MLTLVSALAPHFRALRENPDCALMLGEVGDKGDPLTHPVFGEGVLVNAGSHEAQAFFCRPCNKGVRLFELRRICDQKI